MILYKDPGGSWSGGADTTNDNIYNPTDGGWDPGRSDNASAQVSANQGRVFSVAAAKSPDDRWCEMFAGNVLAEVGIPHQRFETAILDAISGPLYRGRAPAGSLVFFDQRTNPNGHVGIALGDGTMLSALSGGIVWNAYESWPSYLGWRPYGVTAPGDATFVLTPLLFPVESDDIHLAEMPPWPEQGRWYAPPPYIAPQTALK